MDRGVWQAAVHGVAKRHDSTHTHKHVDFSDIAYLVDKVLSKFLQVCLEFVLKMYVGQVPPSLLRVCSKNVCLIFHMVFINLLI